MYSVVLYMLIEPISGLIPASRPSTGTNFILNISSLNLVKERYPLHTYSEAVKHCTEKYSTILPVISDYTSYAKYVNLAEENNIGSFWLPFKVTYFDKFKYLNSDFLISVPGNESGSDQACVSINMDSPQHRPLNCRSTHLGYLCLDSSLQGKDCIESAVSARQVKVNGKCYSVHLEKRNWFDARWLCSSRGQLLAPVHPNDVKDLTDRLRKLFPNEVCMVRDFWIGLRKLDFAFKMPGIKLDGTYMRVACWDFNQPQLDGECVKMFHKNYKVYYWATVSCDEKCKTVCSEGMSTTTAIKTGATSPVPSADSGPSNICRTERDANVALGVLLGLSIIGLIACVIYIVNQRRTRRNYENLDLANTNSADALQ